MRSVFCAVALGSLCHSPNSLRRERDWHIPTSVLRKRFAVGTLDLSVLRKRFDVGTLDLSVLRKRFDVGTLDLSVLRKRFDVGMLDLQLRRRRGENVSGKL